MHDMYNLASLLSGATKCSGLPHFMYQLQKNFIKHMICVLNRSVKFSIIVFILKISEQHFIMTVRWSKCKVPVILSDFNNCRIF